MVGAQAWRSQRLARVHPTRCDLDYERRIDRARRRSDAGGIGFTRLWLPLRRVALQLTIQGATVQTEHLSRTRLVSVQELDDAQHVALLDLVERQDLIAFIRSDREAFRTMLAD